MGKKWALSPPSAEFLPAVVSFPGIVIMIYERLARPDEAVRFITQEDQAPSLLFPEESTCRNESSQPCPSPLVQPALHGQLVYS